MCRNATDSDFDLVSNKLAEFSYISYLFVDYSGFYTWVIISSVILPTTPLPFLFLTLIMGSQDNVEQKEQRWSSFSYLFVFHFKGHVSILKLIRF